MNRQLPDRRTIHLQGYDYSNEGLYFVTICCQDRRCVFGNIHEGEMMLNEAGQIADYTWHDLPNHNSNIQLDAWCIMPNHVHGIIIINNDLVGVDYKSTREDTVGADSKSARINRTGLEPAPTRKNHGLPEIVRQFKTFSARRINQLNGMQGIRLWQRNYYEHIIHNGESHEKIFAYIYDNPARWADDEYFTE